MKVVEAERFVIEITMLQIMQKKILLKMLFVVTGYFVLIVDLFVIKAIWLFSISNKVFLIYSYYYYTHVQ